MKSPDALSSRLKKKFPAHTGPRIVKPGEASGPVINTMQRERYIPTQHSGARVGLAVYQ